MSSTPDRPNNAHIRESATNRPSRVTDAAAVVALFVVTGLVYLRMVHAANATSILTGEEASVSFVDAVALGERFQFTHFSTNFSGHLFYWLVSHISPGFDLFYGRWGKAVAMSAIAPLLYVTLRHRLDCRRFAAVVGALLGALLPGVVSFSWLAFEIGLEPLVGLTGLLVATTKRSWWWISPIFAGVAVSTYGAGIPWAFAIALVVVWRFIREAAWGSRTGIGIAAAGAAGFGIIGFPLAWWGGGTIVTGGGALSPGAAVPTVQNLWAELTRHGDSYYYFNDQPALGSLPLAVIAAAALVFCACVRRETWPWIVVALATIAVYAVSGGIFGVRRTIALSLVAALLIGVALDALGRVVARRHQSASWVLIVVCAVGLLLPVTLQAAANSRHLESGDEPLPVDFAFPIAPTETMPQTLATIAARLRAGEPWAEIARTWEGERTSAMLLLLERRGAIAPLPVSGTTVEKLYRQGPRCESDCMPVSGRP